MDLTRKLKNAGIWQLLQVVVQAITQFVYIAVMARLLSKADFGLMALASSFIGIGIIFSEGGMGSALIQRQNITQKHINAALQGNLFIGLAVFVIFFFTAHFIAQFYNQPLLELIIKVIGVNVILSSVNNVSRGLLHKNFQFKITSNVIVFTTIIGYTIGIVLAFLGFGVWSLVATTLAISLLSTACMFYYAPIKLSVKFYLQEWKELFSFGFGVILLKINNYIGTQGINLVLGKIFPPAQLGVFERTYSIKTIPSRYLGNILDTIMFPAMSEIQDENVRLFRIYQHSLGVVNSVLMPVAVFLIFFSEEVVLILLGDKWLEAVLPLQIMFAVLPFSSSGRMADSVIRAKGLIYKNVVRKFLYVLVLITTVSMGAINYGLKGAAIGVTFSYLFNYIIMLILVEKIFNKRAKEIFLLPILSGLKLSLLMLLQLMLFSFLLKQFETSFILNFIIITFLMIGVMGLIIWKKPALLGVYLQETIIRLFSKIKK